MGADRNGSFVGEIADRRDLTESDKNDVDDDVQNPSLVFFSRGPFFPVFLQRATRQFRCRSLTACARSFIDARDSSSPTRAINKIAVYASKCVKRRRVPRRNADYIECAINGEICQQQQQQQEQQQQQVALKIFATRHRLASRLANFSASRFTMSFFFPLSFFLRRARL